MSRFYKPEYADKYGEAFARGVAFVLDNETEFNRDGSVRTEHDPSDPGGETRFGIDQRSHKGVDIDNLTESDAVAIYHATEWTSINGDQLPPSISTQLLDTAVNPGIAPACHWLQEALNQTVASANLSLDGQIGPRTVAVAHSASPEQMRAIAKRVQDHREAYYNSLPEYRHGMPFKARFIKGWLARVEGTRALIV